MMEDADYQALKLDILAHGQRVPITILNGAVLDGRNRLKACDELGITPELEFITEGVVGDPQSWVLSTNLHRRHLSESQRALIAATIAGLPQGGDRKSEDFKGQKCTLKEAAEMLHVGERTVKNARAVIASGDDELIQAVKAGDIKVSRAAEIIKDRKPHVSQNSGDNEWYTPEDYIQAGREVLGGINLDPASSAAANEVVAADAFYTHEDDGLSKPWSGKVWCNPPYSKELCGSFVEKLVDEYSMHNVTEALLLVNNATETQWFQMAARVSTAICFPEKRVKFWKPDGTKGQPLQGQAVVYFGGNVSKFAAAFSKFGQVVGRIGGAE